MRGKCCRRGEDEGTTNSIMQRYGFEVRLCYSLRNHALASTSMASQRLDLLPQERVPTQLSRQRTTRPWGRSYLAIPGHPRCLS